jgi:hypothetical protein
MDEEQPEPLNYATPEVRERKESIEYYREPPALSEWTRTDFIIWIVAFVVVLGVLFWFVASRWSRAWN